MIATSQSGSSGGSSPEQVVAWLREPGVVPVIVMDDPVDAVPLGRALTEGGLDCAEITFRTRRAAEVLGRITDEYPGMVVGAGTVLTPQQAAEARRAGARFVVAPGFNPAVVDYCLEHRIPVFPGVCTPTEIEAALQKGLSVLKFFPAEAIGGLPYLKAIAAPYAGVQFIPTGGINAGNLDAYLALPYVVACGGSWMAPQAWIAAKQFDRIREESARAAAVAQSARRPAAAATGGAS